ncbi:MAG: MoxR family ATPase [Bacteroidetes bacterium]|nr:MAG: MoxR family ATPase [Bacteroidota bacterium]
MALFSNTSQAQLDQHIEERGAQVKALMQEMEKIIVGQQHIIERLLMGLFTNGHILLEGVPGLAKTLTISTLARVLDLQFQRIQFTPDLLPADLVGTMVYNQQKGRFEVKKGPIFANIILADEINRSPAKVQSALLEAMQEKQVTIGEKTFGLDRPFLVLATQNPIDQEGTYPLPEAQVDRFMMKVYVTYPSKEEEKAIMKRMAKTQPGYEVQPVLTRKDIFAISELIDHIQLSEQLEDYIVNLVMATRDPRQYGLPQLAEYIDFGASPRASLALNLGARAHAFLQGRSFALPEDVKAIARDVLNHRLILNYEAEAEEITPLHCLDLILGKVEI